MEHSHHSRKSIPAPEPSLMTSCSSRFTHSAPTHPLGTKGREEEAWRRDNIFLFSGEGAPVRQRILECAQNSPSAVASLFLPASEQGDRWLES